MLEKNKSLIGHWGSKTQTDDLLSVLHVMIWHKLMSRPKNWSSFTSNLEFFQIETADCIVRLVVHL